MLLARFLCRSLSHLLNVEGKMSPEIIAKFVRVEMRKQNFDIGEMVRSGYNEIGQALFERPSASMVLSSRASDR